MVEPWVQSPVQETKEKAKRKKNQGGGGPRVTNRTSPGLPRTSPFFSPESPIAQEMSLPGWITRRGWEARYADQGTPKVTDL
jgi:hypothetical protein